MDASVNRDEHIHDAFIGGIKSSITRQRLLENSVLDLDATLKQARILDQTQRDSDSFPTGVPSLTATTRASGSEPSLEAEPLEMEPPLQRHSSPLAVAKQLCHYCELDRHARKDCPA